jgi:hypothetical protein
VRALRAFLVLALGIARAAAAAGGPDLVPDPSEIRTSFDLQSFAPTSCELDPIDRCVDAPGARKLLRFGVFAVNQGDDLVLGVPKDGDPMWLYSPCHRHFHFESFARYELRRADGTGSPVYGQKRSFCVEDTRAASATTPRKYCCNADCGNVQGIQSGWGDLYPESLPCQWIDVTDVAPGDYTLCVVLNHLGLLPESDLSNNTACVPVRIDGPDPRFPPPRVRVQAPARRARLRAGRTFRVRWQARVRGEERFQEVWFSRDGGGNFELLTTIKLTKVRTFRWSVPADATSADARIRVVTCVRNPKDGVGAGALQCGRGESKAFTIRP